MSIFKNISPVKTTIPNEPPFVTSPVTETSTVGTTAPRTTPTPVHINTGLLIIVHADKRNDMHNLHHKY